MSISITIASAPAKFRPYLDQADKTSTGPTQSNGIIETKEEIDSAISAYCSDDPNNCKELVEYFSKAADYPNESFELKLDHYPSQFRISVAPVFCFIGFQHFNYASLGETRHVPPHPDDQGTVTKPITPKGKNSALVKFGFELTLDFWQKVFLNYQFAPLENEPVPSSIEKVKPGSYNYYGGYPPINRQRYASGENAYTFIIAPFDRSNKAHYITLGFYAPLSGSIKFDPSYTSKAWKASSEDSHLSIDAGLAVKQFHVIRGWDRYAAVEIMDNKNVTVLGGTIGLHYSQGFNNLSGSTQLGLKFGLRGSYFPGGSFSVIAESMIPIGLAF